MSKTKPKPREAMSPLDVEAATMLNIVRKKLDTPDHKMFVYRVARRGETHPERGITTAQRWYLWDLVYRYRRLLANKCGRNDDLWASYRRLSDAAYQMHKTSNLRWTVRDLRREANSETEVPVVSNSVLEW
jgi:hypothetical protein